MLPLSPSSVTQRVQNILLIQYGKIRQRILELKQVVNQQNNQLLD